VTILLKFWGIAGPKSAQCTLKWAAAEFHEFAAVSRGIWQTAPRNLAKFAAENWDLIMCSEYVVDSELLV